MCKKKTQILKKLKKDVFCGSLNAYGRRDLLVALAVVFGGVNMDIHCRAAHPLRMQDSNIGTVLFAPGGVGRNIAENMARLGIGTTLVTALGSDANGAAILASAKAAGFAILPIGAHNTPTYVCIVNETGELVVAINHMNDLEQALTSEALAPFLPLAQTADAVVLDANLTTSSIEYIANAVYKPIVFDPVSTVKCVRAQGVLGRFHTIKPNRAEAATLTGCDTSTEKGLECSADFLLRKGVKRVFITLGAEGVFYADESERGFLRVPPIRPANATGAGDAFTAALVYSLSIGHSLGETAAFACGASRLALMHPAAINPELSPAKLFQLFTKEFWAYDDV